MATSESHRGRPWALQGTNAEALALGFAMVFPTLGTWLYFVVLADSAWTRVAFAGFKTVQFAFPWLWAAAVERAPLGARPRGRRGLMPGLFAGLAVAGLLAAAYPGLLRPLAAAAGAPAAIGAKLATFGIEGGGGFLLLAAFYALAHSYLEELYWRGFVHARLSRRLGPGPATLLSSLAFTSHHVLLLGVFLGGFGPLTWLAASAVAAAGALWARLYERGGGLAGPWLAHGLADAALMAVGWALFTAGRP